MTASFKESFSPEESSLSSKFLYKETTHTEPNEKKIYICTFEELQKQYSRKTTLKNNKMHEMPANTRWWLW